MACCSLPPGNGPNLTAGTVCRSVGTQSDSLAASADQNLTKRLKPQGVIKLTCRLDTQQARACWGLNLTMMDEPSWRLLRRTRGVSNSAQLAGCTAQQPFRIFCLGVSKTQCLFCFCTCCQTLCAVEPTAPGADQAPAPRHAMCSAPSRCRCIF